MITIIKLNSQGHATFQYAGKVAHRLPHGIVITADWALPERDLGYARFEPGDCFTEYYYTDRWFNIFAIASLTGVRKGWYCNIAEPAMIFADQIRQVDLLLDVWVNTAGQITLLDEDEFAAATTLSEQQRSGAKQGLQMLLQMIEAHEEVFAELSEQTGG